MSEYIDWEALTPEEKKKQLFLKQKNTLDLFLERNAISKAQYDKSLGDLIDKMGIDDEFLKCCKQIKTEPADI